MTLDELIARLHGGGRLRVWSLAVTLFGDAVAPRGGSIAMADLSRVLERLGAEPGAVRTAMSRLARDGYVEREREGRRSFYRLSASAAASFNAASTRIYADRAPEWDGSWTVALGRDVEAPPSLAAAGFVRVTPGAWVAPGDAAAPATMFAVRGDGAPPDWALEAFSPPDLAARYAKLRDAWRDFDPDGVVGVDAIAARTLLIHDWRRVLLRDLPIPRALRPSGWPGGGARKLVARIYERLDDASEAWLDGCRAVGERPLPSASHNFKRRFATDERRRG